MGEEITFYFYEASRSLLGAEEQKPVGKVSLGGRVGSDKPQREAGGWCPFLAGCTPVNYVIGN